MSSPFFSLDTNKLMHILNGNKKLGYNIGVWNCRRSVEDKLENIKALLNKHNLHILGLVETDLHGEKSRIWRNKPLTTEEIMRNLKIENYKIILPQSWYTHQQARVIVYVKDDVKFKISEISKTSDELPSISGEISI